MFIYIAIYFDYSLVNLLELAMDGFINATRARLLSALNEELSC